MSSRIRDLLPSALEHQVLGLTPWQWFALAAGLAGAVVGGRVLAHVSARIGARMASRTRAAWDDELVRALVSPGRLFSSALLFAPIVAQLDLPSGARSACFRGIATFGIIALTWSAIRLVGVASNVVERQALAASGADSEHRIRGVQTQVRVLRRVITVVLVTCASAVLLMQFDVVRNVGVSLLASAGVAGLVLGLAAQRTLGSLLAGLQLSITQPIRIGDAVVVENEFGTIEEITLTYVVVKVWDERRLIVPMARFLEQPFQNWTKFSSELHGTVVLQAESRLEALRRRAPRGARTPAREEPALGRAHQVRARHGHEE